MNNENIVLAGNVRALLEVYKNSINELIDTIKPLDKTSISKVLDEYTNDQDCKTIQHVLSHVVCSGYGYTIYIENAIGNNKPRLEKVVFNNVNQYIEQLNKMYDYCENFFKSNTDLSIEEYDNLKKIKVNWGQYYDIEQLMEHAIVHVLRHRRQIENFIIKLNK